MQENALTTKLLNYKTQTIWNHKKQNFTEEKKEKNM